MRPPNSISRTTLGFSRVCHAILLIALATGFVGCQQSTLSDRQTVDRPATDKARTGSVELAVEFNGRGDDQAWTVDWNHGDTVHSVMIRSREKQQFDFSATGSGATVFVTSIADVANEGASGDNWVFRINEKMGKISCGVAEVQAGDRIVWRLGSYPEEAPESDKQ